MRLLYFYETIINVLNAQTICPIYLHQFMHISRSYLIRTKIQGVRKKLGEWFHKVRETEES